ncbi:MAG TPA: NAD(P)-binding protein [Leptospiraceae bacterium]|nr:NAD(P)-binding protein [Leptospiraceae bacterium]HMW04348.1 NAD(P)-binding protein [Leptospiraceae bacterium]HMX31082.1 NAD(P)-binding protein [Leptospiraceae bacterium]HMY31898.1 NAD(P)-binding protein [Leptospiraceae bacterium]HMZ65256.1 NAD(P)-binding protein [Leptospiraceae bacterium]
MKIGIIGSGITGAVLARLLPDAVVFERASHSGGRTTTRFLGNSPFDIGATIFKGSIDYIEKGKLNKFDFLKFLSEHLPELEVVPHKTHPGSYHLTTAMQDLTRHLLSNTKVEYNHLAESISKKPSEKEWTLHFSNGKTETFDLIILTAPVPQVISILKNSGIMQAWDELIRFRGEYRSCLVLTGIWKNLPTDIIQKIKSLKQQTYLFKDEDAEYFSLESEKYRISESDNSLVVTIQFSSAFSSKNLERWCDDEKKPLYYILNSNQYFFNRVFHALDLPELISKKPDHMDTHKWRYSQADFALFKDTEIQLDHPKLLEFFSLSRKHNIWMTGDWIWGSRIVRCALGAMITAKEILKEGVN